MDKKGRKSGKSGNVKPGKGGGEGGKKEEGETAGWRAGLVDGVVVLLGSIVTFVVCSTVKALEHPRWVGKEFEEEGGYEQEARGEEDGKEEVYGEER